MSAIAESIVKNSISIDAAMLARELRFCSVAGERRSTIPILGRALITAAEGRIRVTMTDLEVVASSEFSGAGTLAVAVPPQLLLGWLETAKDHITIGVDGGSVASLKSGDSRASISCMSHESFPELPKTPAPLFQVDAAVLHRMIRQVAFAISMEESRFTLNGALLEIGPSGMCMVATDGHRLAYVHDPGIAEDPLRMLIPKKALAMLSGLDDVEPIAVSADDNHAFFVQGARAISARKLIGNFPDYGKVLEHSAGPIRATVQREALLRAIARALPFTVQRSWAGRLYVAPDKLTVTAESVDCGSATESVPCALEGEELDIGFNFQYLVDFLGAMESYDVTLLLKNHQSAGEFREGDGSSESFRHVVMPMRT